MSIKDNLIKLRKKYGHTKKDIAEALKIPYTTYQNYENAGNEPPYQTLKKIAAYYGVTIEALLNDDNEAPLPTVSTITELSEYDSSHFTPAFIIEKYAPTRTLDLFDANDSCLFEIHAKALAAAKETYENFFLREVFSLVVGKDDLELEKLQNHIAELQGTTTTTEKNNE